MRGFVLKTLLHRKTQFLSKKTNDRRATSILYLKLTSYKKENFSFIQIHQHTLFIQS